MDYEKIEKNARLRDRVRKTITYFFLTVWGILVLFPFYWMVLTSVKSYGAYNSEWIPKLYTLSPTWGGTSSTPLSSLSSPPA